MTTETAKKEVPFTESQGARQARDVNVWNALEELIKQNGHSFKHVLELWPAYVRRLHFARFIAHYELFKQVIDSPGCIVELGVFRGSSFFTFAKLMETFCPGDRKRLVLGFDSFEGLTDLDEKLDGKTSPENSKTFGGYSAGAVKDEIEQLTYLCNQDNFIKGNERCKLIVGNVRDTVPKYLEENPGLRISLLHLDMDLYAPTKVALQHLYPLVVKGGLVVLDEYGLMPWEGESRAVEDYFKEIGEPTPVMKKFPFATQPHGYFIK
jgi:hypothetical protein